MRFIFIFGIHLQSFSFTQNQFIKIAHPIRGIHYFYQVASNDCIILNMQPVFKIDLLNRSKFLPYNDFYWDYKKPCRFQCFHLTLSVCRST